MKDKKFQIFVSSTYTDLKEERQSAVEAILSSGHIPAGMELFSAGDESQMTVIERWIDESDIYLLILGGRYGSIDKKTGKSYTQLEFEYAVHKKKPLFAVVITDEALEEKIKKNGGSVIEQENPKELKEFRALVLNNLVKFWEDRKDIKLAIHETISDFSFRKDLVGWIRGDNAINTGILAEEIARLTKENSSLRDKIDNSSTDSNVLYSGLSYSELKELLLNDKIDVPDGESNLFDLLVENGRILSIELSVSEKLFKDAFSRLRVYKLITERSFNGIDYMYSFTEDGNNFYLKTLLNDKNKRVA